MIGYWISFGIIFFIIFVTVPLVRIFLFKFTPIPKTKKLIREANTGTVLIIFFLCVLNCFYMATFTKNLLLKFVFGVTILLITFVYLIDTFTEYRKRTKIEKAINVLDFVTGVTLSIYLIYLIPSQELQSIVIPIAAALYGGIITFIGVLLTIRKTDNDKKQEEIRKFRPLVFVYDYFQGEDKGEPIYKSLYSKNEIGTLKQVTKDEKGYFLNHILLYNSDYSYVSLVGFKINDNYHIFDIGQVLEKSKYYDIESNFVFSYSKQIYYVALILRDMLDNIYELQVDFNIIQKTSESDGVINIVSVLKTELSKMFYLEAK